MKARLLPLLALGCLVSAAAGLDAEAQEPSEEKVQGALYPQPDLTPGLPDPAVTQENIHDTICVPGYTRTVRAVSAATKREVFLEYGEDPARHGEFEVDHFISLELGGSNDIKNLWPEPYCPLPRKTDCYGAREKDAVETWLHRQVCAGKISLKDAQESIIGDWFAVYRKIPRKRKKKQV